MQHVSFNHSLKCCFFFFSLALNLYSSFLSFLHTIVIVLDIKLAHLVSGHFQIFQCIRSCYLIFCNYYYYYYYFYNQHHFPSSSCSDPSSDLAKCSSKHPINTLGPKNFNITIKCHTDLQSQDGGGRGDTRNRGSSQQDRKHN